MNVAAFIDGTVVVVVVGGALWALAALFVLGLCRAGALEDEAMARYLAEQHGIPEDEFDAAARTWIAEARRAS